MTAVNAIVRFSRDQRGYEHYYLMSPPRRGQARRRVLYWFRTPPSVKVGRAPFDPDVRRFIESQNPGVTFDWTSLLNFTVPSADVERWRERRRERALARQTGARDERPDALDQEASAVSEPSPEPVEGPVEGESASGVVQASGEGASPAPEVHADATTGRRRRRRRHRRRSGDRSALATGVAAPEPQAPGEPAGPSDLDSTDD